MTLRQAIEADFGKPAHEALRRLAESGMTMDEVGEKYGTTKYGVRSLKIRLGCDWRWPTGKSTRQKMRENARHQIRVEYRGRLVTLAEIARRANLNYTTVVMRYRSGLRGKDLTRRPSTRGQRPAEYELGISMSDWKVIVDHARATSIGNARHKFGVPEGAIKAALRGEWHRLA